MAIVTKPTRRVRRAHVVMPEDLLRRVDALVGERGRSRFITEAVEEQLKRRDRVVAFERFAGSLQDVDIPGWETSEAAAEWVHNLRYHPEKVTVREANGEDG
jgi:metal-responsive CopG/Arc/MetJ family transcriptional regulator